MKRMKRSEFIEKWLEALESGEYKQVKEKLWNYSENNPKYCCLGVACKLAEIDIDNETDGMILPDKMQRLVGINNEGQFVNSVMHNDRYYTSLVNLNDDGVRFKTIARIIRENLAAKNFRKPG